MIDRRQICLQLPKSQWMWNPFRFKSHVTWNQEVVVKSTSIRVHFTKHPLSIRYCTVFFVRCPRIYSSFRHDYATEIVPYIPCVSNIELIVILPSLHDFLPSAISVSSACISTMLSLFRSCSLIAPFMLSYPSHFAATPAQAPYRIR